MAWGPRPTSKEESEIPEYLLVEGAGTVPFYSRLGEAPFAEHLLGFSTPTLSPFTSHTARTSQRRPSLRVTPERPQTLISTNVNLQITHAELRAWGFSLSAPRKRSETSAPQAFGSFSLSFQAPKFHILLLMRLSD